MIDKVDFLSQLSQRISEIRDDIESINSFKNESKIMSAIVNARTALEQLRIHRKYWKNNFYLDELNETEKEQVKEYLNLKKTVEKLFLECQQLKIMPSLVSFLDNTIGSNDSRA